MDSPFDEKTNPGTNFRYFEGRLLFQKRFLLKRMIGRGGMGEVWLATDTQLGKDVALKFTPQEVARDERSLAELRREVTVGQELTHPRIVRVNDFLHGEGEAAISMEYVDGRSSSDVQAAGGSLFFEPEEIRTWVDDVLQALDYAHREGKRAHRDVKPKNILIENATGRAKLADFGISRRIVDTMARHSRPDTSGALPYMSPQQQAGLLKPAPQDDFYSLGATIYEWLTGAAPFFQGDIADQVKHQTPPPMAPRRADLVGEIISHPGQPIPEGWERAVAACLSKEREQRPSSAAEFWALVNASPAPGRDRPPGGPDGDGRSSPRSRVGDDALSANKADTAPPNAASPRRPKIIAALAGIVLSFAGLTWAVTQMKNQPASKPATPDPAIARMKEEQERFKQQQDRLKKEQSDALVTQKQEAEILRVDQEKLRKDKADADEQIAKANQEAEKQRLALEQLRKDKEAADAKTKTANDAVERARLDAELAKAQQQRQADLAKASESAKLKSPASSTKEQPFANSLGMKFVPIGIKTGGKTVLFSIWETRRKDFSEFVENSSGYRYEDGSTPHVWTGKWEQKAGTSWKNPGFEQTETHPVTGVSHEDTVVFCKWLTEKERASLPTGAEYRLPTDAEWSYAVGIGDKEDSKATPKAKNEALKDVWPWGTSWPPTGKDGNYADARRERNFTTYSAIKGYDDGYATTSPAGSFAANPHGLHDLGGNVWEWCGSYYDGSSGPRVLRGGAWDNNLSHVMLSSYRESYTPTRRDVSYGFRCVLVVSGP